MTLSCFSLTRQQWWVTNVLFLATKKWQNFLLFFIAKLFNYKYTNAANFMIRFCCCQNRVIAFCRTKLVLLIDDYHDRFKLACWFAKNGDQNCSTAPTDLFLNRKGINAHDSGQIGLPSKVSAWKEEFVTGCLKATVSNVITYKRRCRSKFRIGVASWNYLLMNSSPFWIKD